MLYYTEGSHRFEIDQGPNSPVKIFSDFPIKLTDNIVLLSEPMKIIVQ